MSDQKQSIIGSIAWTDLTIENAEPVRDFYSKVVGWKVENVPMSDYQDFSMMQPFNNNPVAGICHARGANADLPAQWLIYIVVKNLDKSIAECNENGGSVISGTRKMAGHGRYCVIQDPAGAVAALFEQE